MRLNPKDKNLVFKDTLSGNNFTIPMKDVRQLIKEDDSTLHIVDKKGVPLTIITDRDMQIKLFKFFSKLKYVKIMKGSINEDLGLGTVEPI